LSDEQLDELVGKFDEDGDGVMNFNEFVVMTRFMMENMSEDEDEHGGSPTKKGKPSYKKQILRKLNDMLSLNCVAQLVAVVRHCTDSDDAGVFEALNNDDGYVTCLINNEGYRIFQWCCGGTILGGVCKGDSGDKTVYCEISDGQFSANPYDDEERVKLAEIFNKDLADQEI